MNNRTELTNYSGEATIKYKFYLTNGRGYLTVTMEINGQFSCCADIKKVGFVLPDKKIPMYAVQEAGEPGYYMDLDDAIKAVVDGLKDRRLFGADNGQP